MEHRRNPSSAWLLHTIMTPVLSSAFALSNDGVSNKSRVSAALAGGFMPHSALSPFLPGLSRDSTAADAASSAAVNSSIDDDSDSFVLALYTNDNGSGFSVDNSTQGPHDLADSASRTQWVFLLLFGFAIVGVLGNVLVCVAVCFERRLQTATNFFLLSLAVADLLVSLLVMPLSIFNEYYGECKVLFLCSLYSAITRFQAGSTRDRQKQFQVIASRSPAASNNCAR